MKHDVRLIRSPTSIVGMALTTISAVLFLIVFLADLFGLHTNPYTGILFFLILPGMFLLGLVLIPLGAWHERRRRHAGKPPSEITWPRIDLNNPAHRRRAVAVFALTMANVVIVSLAAYRGVEYMDSVSFCGQVCHTPMRPEFVAHQDGPHARVACVECHIGAGARSFTRSKIAGIRRVVNVAFSSYARPIPVPVQELRSADEICEACHWSEKLHGDKIRRVVEYGNDEKNTESVTTLRVHVGGGNEHSGIANGIHWHMNVANEIDYVASDDKRETIPYVRLKDRFGNVREYFADGTTAEQIDKGERRRMDCMDCHNRPSHQIALTPERAVDDAIARGKIPKTLPFIRREAVKALKAAYPSHDVAAAGISRAVLDFYRGGYESLYVAQRQDIERAAVGVGDLYRRNIFPEMNVTFGTYPSNIGHVDSPGCFRCHDDNHKSKDGKTIAQDCETCHSIE
jgi:hypothetical protein